MEAKDRRGEKINATYKTVVANCHGYLISNRIDELYIKSLSNFYYVLLFCLTCSVSLLDLAPQLATHYKYRGKDNINQYNNMHTGISPFSAPGLTTYKI